MRFWVSSIVVILGAFLISFGFNQFLIPHRLLSGGVSGLSMLIGYFMSWNIGLLYFFINLPILAAGWFWIGRWYVVLSIISVLATSWFMQIVPSSPFVGDPVLAAVFGGVLVGVGTGISLRAGGSTGGFDIIGSLLTRKRDFPLGTMIFILNAVVILALGYMNNWDLALYSMLSIFITGKVVDGIHIRHLKVTAFIITRQKEQMLNHLLKLDRGVTIIKTEGGYTHHANDLLLTVTTRYELAELKRTIKKVDPGAFVNIVETAEVMGVFRKPPL